MAFALRANHLLCHVPPIAVEARQKNHFANQTTLQNQTVTGAATPKEEICQKMGPARCTQRSSKNPPSIQAPFPGVLNTSEIAARMPRSLTFAFCSPIVRGGRGNGKRVARRLHCRPGSHESAAAC